jgi:hypothetical protein
MREKRIRKGIALVALGAVLAIAWRGGAAPPTQPASPGAPAPATAPASTPAPAPTPTPAPKKPADNLAYWLGQAATAQSRPAGEGNSLPPPGKSPFQAETDDNFRRADSLPGVIQLSNGQVLAGYMYTTAEKEWQVWVETEKRWRRVPFAAALSIAAVLLEEKMEPVWRWKEMGVPERVYTGEAYPTRRLDWEFHLVDGSTITGTIKGQPIWIEQEGQKLGPYVLNESVRGPNGQALKDLVTVRQIIVSPRLMEQVLPQAKPPGEKRPDGRSPLAKPSPPGLEAR